MVFNFLVGVEIFFEEGKASNVADSHLRQGAVEEMEKDINWWRRWEHGTCGASVSLKEEGFE